MPQQYCARTTGDVLICRRVSARFAGKTDAVFLFRLLLRLENVAYRRYFEVMRGRERPVCAVSAGGIIGPRGRTRSRDTDDDDDCAL